MDGNLKRLVRALPGLIVALALGACGWAEWPPHSRVQAVNAPPPFPHTAPVPAPQDGSGRSDAVFVGADSVTVGRGDTVYALSRRHLVSPRAIIEANDLQPPYALTVGQKIVLPRERKHQVSGGETLYGISRRYAIDMYTLAKANGLQPPYTIVVGQELRIPAGSPAVRQVAASGPASNDQIVATDLPQTAPTLASPAPVPAPAPAPAEQPQTAVVAEPPARGGGFVWPLDGEVVSRFGPKSKGLHNDGINIAAPRGAEVRAAENGVVAYAGNEIRGFGNLLLIKHDGGWITAYAHNDAILVQRGQRIDRGQVIARVGSTGNVTSPQLHFELRRGRNAVDPMVYLAPARTS